MHLRRVIHEVETYLDMSRNGQTNLFDRANTTTQYRDVECTRLFRSVFTGFFDRTDVGKDHDGATCKVMDQQ